MLSGLGPQVAVEDLLSRMSSEDSTTAATAGSEAAAAALQQLIKSESSSDPGAGPPPGLIPLPGRDAVAAAEKQQVILID